MIHVSSFETKKQSHKLNKSLKIAKHFWEFSLHSWISRSDKAWRPFNWFLSYTYGGGGIAHYGYAQLQGGFWERICRGLWTVNQTALANLRGAQGTRAPLGSKFFQFHAVLGKIWQNHVGTPWRVGTPTSGEILDPPLNGDNYLWGCLNMVQQYIVFRDTVMYYAPYFSSTLDGAMESYNTGYVTG